MCPPQDRIWNLFLPIFIEVSINGGKSLVLPDYTGFLNLKLKNLGLSSTHTIIKLAPQTPFLPFWEPFLWISRAFCLENMLFLWGRDLIGVQDLLISPDLLNQTVYFLSKFFILKFVYSVEETFNDQKCDF